MASAKSPAFLLTLLLLGILSVFQLRAAPPGSSPGQGSEAEAASLERQRPVPEAQPLPDSQLMQAQEVTTAVASPHPRGPKPEEVALIFIILLVLILGTLAGLVFLVMALFGGPPWWAFALGFLSPLIILLVGVLISGIVAGISDLAYNARERRERKRELKANPEVQPQ